VIHPKALTDVDDIGQTDGSSDSCQVAFLGLLAVIYIYIDIDIDICILFRITAGGFKSSPTSEHALAVRTTCGRGRLLLHFTKEKENFEGLSPDVASLLGTSGA